jgi:O-methyltransferase involved in polyketide biosynthesis
MGEQTTQYDGVIPTGWLTAYGRTFTDIPYSQEMFGALEAIRANGDSAETLEIMKDTNLAPQFEARHLMLNKHIAATGIKQVLEVAAGLSTRGLELTADPDFTYVEVDLPGMVADKKKIVGDLQAAGKVPERPNLFIEAGSATDEADLRAAAEHFKAAKPIVIANEGLLRYLSMEAKRQYADSVKTLLRKFGGAWVTSDISLPSIIYKEDDIMAERRKKISAITGINVANNLFKDEDDAKQFFDDLGFSVESHSFSEVLDELTSPARLSMPRDYVDAINASPVVFIMRLKHE